ncbi:MAG: lytic transglycosylase domain-containing protein [Parvibaculum sp.]
MSLIQAIIAPPQITAALQQASARTGTDFSYLLKTAMRESSLNCNAKSNTSSACGLFQFTQQSWLGTMKQDGGDLGLGQYADQISQDSNGRYVVTDPAARQEILALRNDPKVSALMAGAYTSDSQSRLESKLGRSVSGGELYIAHFLGAGGASKLISNVQEAPNTPADELFPAAAAANRSIFYGRDGSPRSVAQVYDNLVAKHRNVSVSDGETQMATGLRTGRATSRVASVQNFSAAVSSYSEPSSSSSSGQNFASAAGGFGGRSTLTLTPGVIEILASLDVPETSHSNDLQAAQDKRDERQARVEELNARRVDDRKMSSLLLPSRGGALG